MNEAEGEWLREMEYMSSCESVDEEVDDVVYDSKKYRFRICLCGAPMWIPTNSSDVIQKSAKVP